MGNAKFGYLAMLNTEVLSFSRSELDAFYNGWDHSASGEFGL